jgi:hypothetical protein
MYKNAHNALVQCNAKNRISCDLGAQKDSPIWQLFFAFIGPSQKP